MGLKVRWSWQSHDHLLAIRWRIRQDKPEAAERVRLRIIETVKLLGALPRIGKPGRRRDTREYVMPRLPYIIVYRTTRTELVVLGILHGHRQEWEGLSDD